MAENENNASKVGGKSVVDSEARTLITALRKDVGYIQNNRDNNNNNDTNLVTKVNELITKINAISSDLTTIRNQLEKTTKLSPPGDTPYGWVSLWNQIKDEIHATVSVQYPIIDTLSDNTLATIDAIV